MAYSQNLEQTHKQQFSDNVQMLAQQMTIPILGAVTRLEGSGEAKSVADLFAAGEYVEAEPRSRRNVENPLEASRRWVFYRPDIKSGQYLDKEDKFKSAMDPTSTLMAGHMAAVRRGIHDRILGIKKNAQGRFLRSGRGILGSATEGKSPSGEIQLPASQTIAHASTGLTLGKLRTAIKRLELADFGLEDDAELYAMLSPHQKDDLIALAVEAQGSLNAFTIDQIRTGKPTALMGINWMFTNRLPYAAATGTTRLVPVWSSRNIVAAFWEDIQGAMWNDTSADNLPYMRVHANLDATRIEDKGVIVIECNEPS